MIPLRLIVPGVLAAAAAAGCFTYFASRPAQVDADQRLSPTRAQFDRPCSEHIGKLLVTARLRRASCRGLPTGRRGNPEASTECAGVCRCR